MPHSLQLTINVEVFQSVNELSAEEQKLLLRAQEATQKAYAPYSGFWVGAALLLADGRIFTGSNQENAAYPSGLCAERSALFGLRSNELEIPIKLMAVSARKANTTLYVPAMPCGSCRQVMAEYENLQEQPIPVLMQAGNNQIYKCGSLGDLLPLQFSKLSLQ